MLAAALLKNSAAGHPGKYFGTDINPGAGFLFRTPCNEAGTFLYGDSIESLNGLHEKIDLFINDSDHSHEYEANDYERVESKLSPDANLLADNAHCSSKLSEYAGQTNRQFLFFHEQSRNQWFPCACIGVAWKAVSLNYCRRNTAEI